MTMMTTLFGATGWNLLAGITATVTPGFAAGLALKTSALVLVTGAAATVLARRSAALRHLMWSLALGGALALPFVATSLPWSLRVLPGLPETAIAGGHLRSTPAMEPAARESITGRENTPTGIAARGTPSVTDPVRSDGVRLDVAGSSKAALPRSAFTWTGWTLRSVAGAAWAGVALLLLLHVGMGRLFLALMARWATPVGDPAVEASFRRLLDASGVRRPVRLLWSRRARVPLTWGVMRPVILLPAEARVWEHERLKLVLHHELAHIRRLDDVTHLLAWLACSLHWFNPLVWWAAGRLRDESEHASDDLVLRGGARASVYARHLLAVVTAMGPRSAPAGAVPLAQRSRFEGRLLAILDGGRARDRVHGPGAVALTAGTAALVVLLGAVAPAPAAKTADPVGLDQAADPGSGSASGPMVPAPRTERVTPDPRPERPAATESDTDADVRAPEPEAATAPRDSASVRALSRALLEDADAEVRRSAAWALGQLEDTRGTPALSRALRDDASVEVRRTAAWALGQVEDASAVDALSAALDDQDAEVRSTALWALGQIESPEAVEPLSRVLRDGSAEVRRTAAWALGQIESREAVGPLIGALTDDDPSVKEQVVWALGQIESEEAVPALVALLEDPSVDVRRQTAWALGQIESDRATAALAVALADSDPEVAKTAAWALGQIEPASAPPALLEAARSGSEEMRATALWALSQIEDPAAVPIYAALLEDSNPAIRETALRGLAAVRDEAAIRAITALLEDPDPKVRAAAVRALAGRGGWGGDPRPLPQPRPRPRPIGG
jgi:HEAT repeat protein/beta-lactamase regulating signal transducer with metallopeptidase domain